MRLENLTVNLNTRARVRLSQKGRAILRASGESIPVEADGSIRCPVWQLMYIFGAHMHVGETKIPFSAFEAEIEIIRG